MPLETSALGGTKPSFLQHKQPLSPIEDFDDDDVLLPPNYKTMYPFSRGLEKREIESNTQVQVRDPLYQSIHDLTDRTALPHHNVAAPVYGSANSEDDTNEQRNRTQQMGPKRPWTPIRFSLLLFNVMLLVYTIIAPIFGMTSAVVTSQSSNGSQEWHVDTARALTYNIWFITIVFTLPTAVFGVRAFLLKRYKKNWYIIYLVGMSINIVLNVGYLGWYVTYCFRRQNTNTAPELTEIGVAFLLFFLSTCVLVLVIMLTFVDMDRGRKFEASIRENDVQSESGTNV